MEGEDTEDAPAMYIPRDDMKTEKGTPNGIEQVFLNTVGLSITSLSNNKSPPWLAHLVVHIYGWARMITPPSAEQVVPFVPTAVSLLYG